MSNFVALAYGGTPVDYVGQPPEDSSGSGRSPAPKKPSSDEGKLAEALVNALGNRTFDIDYFAYLLTMYGGEASVDLFRVILALFREWGEALDTESYFTDDERTVYVMARKIVKVMQQPDEHKDDTQPLNIKAPNPDNILD